MKHLKYYIFITAVIFALSSCGLDNYDAPKSKLQGKITYNGQTIGLRGTGEAVQLQLYQDGYELNDHIRVYVGQEGTFEALLFDGEYKLVTRDNNGPWVNNRDTTIVKVKGNTPIELKVVPYYTIDGESIELSNGQIKAVFNLDQVVSSAEIDYATLLVSKTSFVDDATNIVRRDFPEVSVGSVNLSLDVADNKELAAAKALFARIGVRTKGADQSIYSNIFRLK